MSNLRELNEVERLALRDGLLDFGEWQKYVRKTLLDEEGKMPNWYWDWEIRQGKYIHYVRTQLNIRTQLDHRK